jgi:sugar O-acyltransferase (sialic acid O-acetyltransferase NeuD family)
VRPLLVLGSSGHASVVLDAIELQGVYQVVGLLDSFQTKGTQRHGYEILGSPEEAVAIAERCGCRAFVVAVGDNWSRWQLTLRLQEAMPDIELAAVVHPAAVIARSARVHSGSVVFAGSVIGQNVIVETGCIVNVASSVNHDCHLEPYASLAPGVHLGGAVKIGLRSSAGISSAVREKVVIGRDTVLGAGAVLLNDLPDQVVAFGVPAKVRRPRKTDEAYLG